jgi:NADP-dependent 3-hydroxy acid dehydrogenase YdfG
MAQRAALITGASRGIGLAMARALAQDGYGLTLAARKPETLADVAAELTAAGHAVVTHAGNVSEEATCQAIVALHQSTYGRLDVLVNNAGVGIGAGAGEQQTKFIDLQLGVNLRSLVILYRDCLEMLKADGGAHVINLASITGKSPQPWLSVYSATKAAIIAYTEAMNKELGAERIRSTALCPAFVDTDMAAFTGIDHAELIQPSDVVAAMRFVLSLSPATLIPEIVIARAGDNLP